MAYGGKITYDIGFNVDKSGLNELYQSLGKIQNMTPQSLIGQSNKSNANIQQVTKQLKEAQIAAAAIGPALQKSFDTRLNVINVKNFANEINKTYGSVNNLFAALKNSGSTGQQVAAKLSQSLLTTRTNIQKTETVLDKMGTTLMNTLKWTFSSSLINRFIGTIQQAVGYVEHLDQSLNDIRIVTKKSADEMELFGQRANKAAQELGKATTDYTEAALIYYQQGLSDEEVKARAETTLKAANVTGQATKTVSEQLTAVWNGFKVNAEQTEEYVDKLAAVAAMSASNLEELSTGMSKVASAASNLGVDIDQLTAQISTIVSVTRQAPESVGTALKTIYARITDLQLGGTDEDGVGLGKVSGGLDALGIHNLDSQGQLRDLGIVIEEVADKWNDWTAAQQAAVAQLMAGKRQYNNLVALFSNWDMYENAINTSRNATGELQKQQDIYMESTEAHLQQLKTQWEDLYDSLLNSKTINSFADGMKSIVGFATDFVDAIGGGGRVVSHLIGLFGTLFSGKIVSGLTEMINRLTDNRAIDRLIEARKEISAQMYVNTGQITAADEISKAYSSWTKYSKSMTSAQINNMELETQNIAKLAEEVDKRKQNVEAIKDETQAQKEKIQEIQNATDKARVDYNQNRLKAAQEIKQLEAALANSSAPLPGKASTGNFSSRKNKDFSQSFSATDLIQNWNSTDNNIKQIKEDLDNLIQSSENASKAIDKIFKKEPSKDFLTSSGNFIYDPKKWEDFSKTASQAINVAKKGLIDLKNASVIDENTFNRLQGVLSGALTKNDQVNKNAWHNTKDALLEIQEIAKVTGIKFTDLRELINKPFDADAFLKTMPSIDEINAKIQELNSLEQEGLANKDAAIEKLEAAKRLLEEQNKLLARQQAISNIISAASAMMQINNAITTISNTVKSISTGKFSLSQLFSSVASTALTATMAISNISKIIKTLGKTAGAALGWVTAIGSAVGLIFSIIKQIKIANLEKDVEMAKINAERATERLEEAKKETEALENVRQKYEDLNKDLKEHNIFIEDARQEVYNLCKEYGLQELAIDVLTNKYEDLKDIIQKVQDEAGRKELKEFQQMAKTVEAQTIAEIKLNEEDEYIGLTPFNFARSSGRMSLEEIKVFDNFEKELSDLGLNFIEGQVSVENFVEVAKEYNDELWAIASKYDIKYSEKLTKALSEHKTNIQNLITANKDEDNAVAKNIIRQSLDPEQINSLNDYVEASNKLKQELKNVYTDENADKLIAESIDNYVKTIDKFGDWREQSDLLSATRFDEKDLIEQYGKRTAQQMAFLFDNIAFANTFKSVDAFFDYVDKSFEHQNRKENVINATVEIKNKNYSLMERAAKKSNISRIQQNANEAMKNQVFTQDMIDSLYDGTNFAADSGVDKKTFMESSYNQQMTYLIQYYTKAYEEEKAYQELIKQRGNIEEDQHYKEIESTKNELDQLQNEWEQYYQGLGDYQVEGDFLGFEQIINNVAQGMNTLENVTSQTYQNNIDNILNTTAAIQKLDDGTIHFLTTEEKRNALINLQTKNYDDLQPYEKAFIKMLQENNELSSEQIDIMARDVFIYKRYTDAVGDSVKEGSNFEEAQVQLSQALSENNDLFSDQSKIIHDAAAELAFINSQIAETNAGIDNMQKAYDSLTSIVQDYNNSQVLTMDNLQTLLEMDTAFIEALDIENGKMSINEEALKRIALARLDEAEAEAYEEAINKLNNYQLEQAYLNTIQAKQGISDLGDAAITAAQTAAKGIDAWNAYWAAATQNSTVNEAYKNAVGKELYNNLNSIRLVREQIQNGKFKATVGKASKSSGSKGSSSKPKTEKELKREEDIYRVINQELSQIESTLGRIDTINSHHWGLSYQKTLKEQNKLLDKQIKKLEEKSKLQTQDLSTRRKQLEMEGVTFSEDGAVMTNAEQVLNELYAGYNKMVKKYNTMSASSQETYKSEMDTEKNRIDAIEKKIDEYENLYSEAQSVLDESLNKYYEKIENEVKQFNAEVEVKLELNDARKEWNDFWKEIIEEVEDTDFGGQIAASLKQLNVLIGLDGDTAESTVALNTQHLNDIVDEVNKQIASADRGGEDSIFGANTTLSKETLQEYSNQLMESLRLGKAEIDNIAESVLGTFHSIQEAIDKQAKSWDDIDKHINHNIELIKLMDTEKAYDALDLQYQQQYQNNLNAVATQKISVDTWQKEMEMQKALLDTFEEGTVEWKTASKMYEEAVENYVKATQDLDAAVTKAIQDLKTQTENANAKVIDTLDKAMSDGLGTDLLAENWKLINDYASKYYDNVERYLNMSEYENVLEEAANAIGTSAANQQKLNEFREQELKQLNERERLTEYDIAESRARLEILKAQIALEDAQANKSKLRLRRDSQGNYNYQYVADEEQVNKNQQDLLNAQKNWYQIWKNQLIQGSNDLIETRKLLSQKMSELADAEAAGDQKRIQEIKNEISFLTEELEWQQKHATKVTQDGMNGIAQYFSQVENATIVPQSEATVRKLVSDWAGEGEKSFIGAVKKAVQDLDQIQADFIKNSNEIFNTAGVNYQNLKNKGIDPAKESLDLLAGSNDELQKTIDDTNSKLDDQIKTLADAAQKYRELRDAAKDALEKCNDAMNTLAKTAIETQKEIEKTVQAAKEASNITFDTATPSSSNSGGGGDGGDTGNSPSVTENSTDNNTYLHIGGPSSAPGGQHPKYTIILGDGKIQSQGILTDAIATGWKQGGYRQFANWDKEVNKQIGSYKIHKIRGNKYQDTYGSNKYYQFRSGGYTGSWGTDGRLAVLHQKELVLNENDTKNMLSAVQILRSIPYSVIAQSLINSSTNTASALSGINSGISGLAAAATNNESKTMVVNADFSGVHDADEIYQALLELENYGLQNSYSVAPHANSMY